QHDRHVVHPTARTHRQRVPQLQRNDDVSLRELNILPARRSMRHHVPLASPRLANSRVIRRQTGVGVYAARYRLQASLSRHELGVGAATNIAGAHEHDALAATPLLGIIQPKESAEECGTLNPGRKPSTET